MSVATIQSIQQQVDNASKLVGLCATMRPGHRDMLMNLAVDSLRQALELLQYEVRGERGTAAVLPSADELDAAESGMSTPHASEHSLLPMPHEQIVGLRGTPRPQFLEPLRISPPPTPRDATPAEAEAQPAAPVAPGEVAVEANTTADAVDADDTASTAPTENTYKDLLAAVGNPEIIHLRVKKAGTYIPLPVSYEGRQPTSRFTEPNGAVFEGTLRQVAGRVKYLKGYKVSRSTANKPEEKKRAMVNTSKDLYYRDEEMGTYVELGAP